MTYRVIFETIPDDHQLWGKRTKDFAAGKRVYQFSGIQRAARLKLDRIEAVVSLSDLAALPGNGFEALKGDRKGQYSIRVNDQ